MKEKDYIEVEIAVGYDYFYVEETEFGEFRGREIIETVRIPIKDAKVIVQNQVSGLDYDDACELVKKYNKKKSILYLKKPFFKNIN